MRGLVATVMIGCVTLSGCSAASSLGLGFYAIHYNYSHAHDRDDEHVVSPAARPLMTAESRQRCEEKRQLLTARAAAAPNETTRVRVLESMPNCLDPTWESPASFEPTVPPPAPKPAPHHSVGLWMLTGFALGLVVDTTALFVIAAGAGG